MKIKFDKTLAPPGCIAKPAIDAVHLCAGCLFEGRIPCPVAPCGGTVRPDGQEAIFVRWKKKGLTDAQLRAMWRRAGGKFHGPKVETGYMAEDKLLKFLRRITKGRR